MYRGSDKALKGNRLIQTMKCTRNYFGGGWMKVFGEESLYGYIKESCKMKFT